MINMWALSLSQGPGHHWSPVLRLIFHVNLNLTITKLLDE